MVLSDTTNRTGIIQFLEKETATQNVSSYTSAIKIVDINRAQDDYQNLVKRVSGVWQADDSNHTKYPNMKFNLVSGQQDYTFTVDEQGNQVQDIYRVECMDPNGKWYLLNPVDEMSFPEAISAVESFSGTPTEYWKTANGIFLKYKSDYSQTLGLRMFFTRSPNYFTVADLTPGTKEPGIPNGHQQYLYWKPAYWYWMPIDQTRASGYKMLVDNLERTIMRDIANRSRDEEQVITSESVNSI